MQRIGFRRTTAGGKDDVAGRLEELLGHLEADSTARPVTGGLLVTMDVKHGLLAYPVINQMVCGCDDIWRNV